MFRSRTLFSPLVATLVTAGIDASLAAGQQVRYSVTELGQIPASNVCPCFDGLTINNVGQVAGRFYDPSGNRHSFFWSAGVMIDIGTLGGDETQVIGMNDLGQLVGYTSAPNDPQLAFVFENGQLTDIGSLGGEFALAADINNAGVIDGSSQRNGPQYYEHAFVRQGGPHLTDLGTLGGPFSDAEGLNEAGTIVGSSWNEQWDIHAVVWDAQTRAIVDLGTLGNPAINHSAALDINDAGQIVGYSHTDEFVSGSQTTRAVLWQDGQLIDLGLLAEAGEGCDPYGALSHTSTAAAAINSDGVIVGNSFPINSCVEPLRPGPFVSRAGGLINLNDLLTAGSQQWIVTSAADINDAGVIAGSARTASAHHSHAVTLTPVPPCAGDADGDGAVDLADLAILLGDFGASGALAGDMNLDGQVDLSDLAILLSNFGTICT